MKRAKIFLIVSISILLIITTIFTLARLNNKQIYNNNTTKIDNNDKRIDGEINQNDDYKLFNDYYDDAKEKIKNLSLEEKISQLLLVRYPENPKTALQNYQFGGYILFAKDFANKTEEEVKTMINELQNISKIPLLIAVDEEGGIVNRVSLNPNLVDSPFKSSQE
ncbi:MAG: beta-hexosaminidase, partial [Romboutsia sp.]|nr:beta-hexosaminidase [Romboutsia sp.]